MGKLIRFDPFAELRSLQKQFFDDDWPGALPNNMQLPITDVYTIDGSYMVIEAHIPYFKVKDVIIEVDDGLLEIQAEKHEDGPHSERRYVVRESSNSFYRRIRLPEKADSKHIDAQLDQGILKVTVPLKKHMGGQKVIVTPHKKMTVEALGKTPVSDGEGALPSKL